MVALKGLTPKTGQTLASRKNSGISPAVHFGEWLRATRTKLGVAQRIVAASANMDSSHYAKVERGKRLLTERQLQNVAKALKVSLEEIRRRMLAEHVIQTCQGDSRLASGVAALVQQHVASSRSEH
jgi:transcriptional regulator with XRE-family HTH domain